MFLPASFSFLVSGKSYEKFYCSTEEGHHHITCPDDTALLTDVSIRKIYRRTQMCEPDVHSDYLVHCQGLIDGSVCEGNKTCSIEVSSRNYVQCGEKTYSPTYFFVRYTCIQSKLPEANGSLSITTLSLPVCQFIRCVRTRRPSEILSTVSSSHRRILTPWPTI